MWTRAVHTDPERDAVIHAVIAAEGISEAHAESLADAWERLAEIAGMHPDTPDYWREAEEWLGSAARLDDAHDNEV